MLHRLENRTRTFGIFPRLPDLAQAEAELERQCIAAPPSPAVRRVLAYLYDRERPVRVSVLDIADACGLRPRRAFEQVQALTTMGLVGQDLVFEVTLAHGVARTSKALAHHGLRIAEALFATGLGLLAAIPAVIFYNKLSGDSDKIVSGYEAFADEFATILSRQTGG